MDTRQQHYDKGYLCGYWSSVPIPPEVCICISTQLYKYIRVLRVFISFRYGWSSETCNKTDESPSPSTPGITCFPDVEPQNIFSNKRENGKKMFGLDNLTQVTDPPLSEHTPPDGSVESAAVCLVKKSFVFFFSCFWTQIL